MDGGEGIITKRAKVNCEDKGWTLRLPGIVGEELGEKFSIVVDQGQAKGIIAYNQAERELSLKTIDTDQIVEEGLY